MAKVRITPTRKPIKGTPVGATLEVTAKEARWLVKNRLAEYAEPEPPPPAPEPPQERVGRTARKRKVAEPEQSPAPAAMELDAPHAPDDPDYADPADAGADEPTRTYRRRDMQAES